jgi:uncharacterized protein (DUF2236 family)
MSALTGWPRERLVTGFRAIVSGNGGGIPDWVSDLEYGEDEGYFGPESAVWAVHGNLATLAGGIRALLVQALHPVAVAGVDEHSSYREDPLGRLAGTTRWLTVTTFGSHAAADRESARVRGMHRRVRGTYTDPGGAQRPYRASDEHLLAWVHAAFTDSFLVCHEIFGGEIPGGPDTYVREWATAAERVGLSTPPRNVAELKAQMARYEPELGRTRTTERTVAFLRNPPLAPPALVGYQVLFAGAASTLPERHRQLLGLPGGGGRTARAAARGLLAGMRAVLGEGPPAAAAAHRRLDALSA